MTDKSKVLEKLKTAVFINTSNTAFIGSLLCSIPIIWNDNMNVPGRTNGKCIELNFNVFKLLNLTEQSFVLLHELWHIAKLHPLRICSRDHETFNKACDYHINTTLIKEFKNNNKYNLMRQSFLDGILLDKSISTYKVNGKTIIRSEEEIYNIIFKENTNNGNSNSNGNNGNTGLYLPGISENDPNDQDNENNSSSKNASYKNDIVPDNSPSIINAVETALQNTTFGSPDKDYSDDSLLGSIRKMLEEYVSPKLKWNVILRQFLKKELDKQDYSWKRPNRRILSTYLPSLTEPEEKELVNISVYIDISGSIDEDILKRVLAELHYIQKTFKPDLITVKLFDTKILKEYKFTEKDDIRKLKLFYGGGTSFKKVIDDIIATKPLCTLILTDLYADLDLDKPKNSKSIFWVQIDHELYFNDCEVPFGTKLFINIDEE